MKESDVISFYEPQKPIKGSLDQHSWVILSKRLFPFVIYRWKNCDCYPWHQNFRKGCHFIGAVISLWSLFFLLNLQIRQNSYLSFTANALTLSHSILSWKHSSRCSWHIIGEPLSAGLDPQVDKVFYSLLLLIYYRLNGILFTSRKENLSFQF